ncbi:MAG: HEAT repeat domain-containing protein, partial [Planctomycetota bacterium]|nr:HEAT repeat domain-containing protein [Planctomycetota bacterium]
EPSVSKLIQALGDEDKRVRSSAVQALAEIGELAHVAVPEVTRLLRDEEQHVRRSAAECIGKIASSEVAIPILMAAMRDENCYVRSCAARSLARFGKDAAPAIPELIKSLRHDWVRVDATITLAEIGKSAVPALLQALKGEKDYARCNAIDILGRMGKDALEAVEAIEEAANQDELLKDKAVEAIKKIQGGE